MKFDDFLYLAAAAFAIGVMFHWHCAEKYPKFSLIDLITTNGKLNDKKLMRFGSWCVMTLGFYTIQMHHPELLPTYAPLYAATWVGAAALDKWQRQRENSETIDK